MHIGFKIIVLKSFTNRNAQILTINIEYMLLRNDTFLDIKILRDNRLKLVTGQIVNTSNNNYCKQQQTISIDVKKIYSKLVWSEIEKKSTNTVTTNFSQTPCSSTMVSPSLEITKTIVMHNWYLPKLTVKSHTFMPAVGFFFSFFFLQFNDL